MSGPNISDVLGKRINRDGPISVAKYMEAVAKAYYAEGTAFGKDGDFVTAPEVSQIFGELIGIWCVTAWQALGQPRNFNLVECGPGRGTLIADALRAIKDIAPSFLDSASVHLVERSQSLRAQQKERLTIYNAKWHNDFSTIPNGKVIIIGNEFLDALPTRQFQKTNLGWCERLVDYKHKEFSYCLDPNPTNIIDETYNDACLGSIIEYSEAVEDIIKQMAQLCLDDRGVSLMIDYGHIQSGIGETLQALKHHSYHPILKEPGTADITAHVDFALVAQAARSMGVETWGPLEQGLWLRRIGVNIRQTQLCAGKSTEDAKAIRSGVRRLVEPDAMGSLFKVIAFAPPGIGPLAGFKVES
ncbi:MAG: class I SAM-dependent methyltransferase [Rhodospirillaceae bacterium]